MTITPFGTLQDGTLVHSYALRNQSGMSVQILDYGCIITSLCVPDRFGDETDVVQGYGRLSHYEEDITLCGAIVGRHANRIAHGTFKIGTEEYQLPVTYDIHHMHGGETGFQKRLFARVPDENPNRLVLTRCSGHGEEGYPGCLTVTMCYELTEDNRLVLSYTANSDAATPVNLTNHSYFNLSGDLCSSILSHRLWLASNRYVEHDATGLPTGKRCPVEGTPFDFRTPVLIGEQLATPHPQTQQVGGYDQYFETSRASAQDPCAILFSSASGIRLRVFSDQPGVHLYSSNKGFSLPGKQGCVYPAHSALCLESQYVGNSMNLDGFPSCILPENGVYRQETVWAFDIQEE